MFLSILFIVIGCVILMWDRLVFSTYVEKFATQLFLKIKSKIKL